MKSLLSNKDNGKDGGNFFTIEDLVRYLGVEKEWVYFHVKEIPHSKVGRFPLTYKLLMLQLQHIF